MFQPGPGKGHALVQLITNHSSRDLAADTRHQTVPLLTSSAHSEIHSAPRARDFPNPHDGEMKSDPAEKLYETPTKKTMILMKWVDWDFSEIKSITLSYNKNN